MSWQSTIHKEVVEGVFEVAKKTGNETLSDCVRDALENYFAHLDGHTPAELYELVMAEVERPLFTCVMQHMGGNQTRAANVLGISRSTLRKKLTRYQIE